MKKYQAVLLLVCALLCRNVQAAFVEGLEDFPVPEGLEQIENASLNFGNEEIRLVEVYMTSEKLNFKQVTGFYKDTLPQLGWKKISESAKRCSFERENEVVEISAETLKPLVINLVLKSKK